MHQKRRQESGGEVSRVNMRPAASNGVTHVDHAGHRWKLPMFWWDSATKSGVQESDFFFSFKSLLVTRFYKFGQIASLSHR